MRPCECGHAKEVHVDGEGHCTLCECQEYIPEDEEECDDIEEWDN